MRSMNATHFLPQWLSLGHSSLIWINYPISPLWHSVSHSVRCASSLPALCHVLAFSCVCVHSCQVDWMLRFLYCLRLIWNSNIASLLSLNNIDFHLHSPETLGMYLGQDCASFLFIHSLFCSIWSSSGLQMLHLGVNISGGAVKFCSAYMERFSLHLCHSGELFKRITSAKSEVKYIIRPPGGALDQVTAARQSVVRLLRLTESTTPACMHGTIFTRMLLQNLSWLIQLYKMENN